MKPSEWIIKRATDKCKKEFDESPESKRMPTLLEHIDARLGWRVPEATLEYLDQYAEYMGNLKAQMDLILKKLDSNTYAMGENENVSTTK